MKKLKKLFAVMLSLIMVLAMGITSFAATSGSSDGKYGTAGDRANITVKGIEKETGTNFSVVAYPIIEAQYDDKGSFSGYKSNYAVAGYDTTTTINSDISTLTPEQLTAFANAINVNGTSYTMLEGNGGYTAEVPVGAYIVLVTGTEAHSYNPMVVSVYYTNSNGGSTVLEDGVLNLKDGEATAKMSDAPEVDKKIVNANKDTNANDKGHSVNIGDTVNYEVSVDPIPNYSGSYPVLNVVDTLSAGLDYNNDVYVTIDDQTLDTAKYTVNYDSTYHKLTVDFVLTNTDDSKNYTLNDYQGKAAIIHYSATLNKDAAMNNVGNENNVVLNYTKDSKKTENNGSKESKTYTYTFDIGGVATGTTNIITKTGVEQGEEAPLPGAVFALYPTENDAKNDRNKIEMTKADGSTYNTATSDANGQLYFRGLKAGTYYLKELTAPAGYSVNTNIYKVDIEATYNNNGTLASWSVKVDNKEVASFTADSSWKNTHETGTTIKNTKLSALPSTGGIGTTIFTIVGCGIMIAAAGLFFASRRKENR